MIDKFKHNTKIKVISLLSALVLWLYVMAVVDPSGKKSFEDIPVTISNMSELSDKNLIVDPETELKTSIYLSGKLSNIQKVKKENIHIYGQVNNAIEGKNEMFLKATISDNTVSYQLKNNMITVILDKVIEEEKPITLNIEEKSKDNIDSVDMDIDKVTITAPRTVMDKVEKVIAKLDTKDKVDNFSTTLKLIPVDKNGKEVSGIELDKNQVIVNVKLLKEKEVPIKVKFQDGTEGLDINKYKLSKDKIIIKGKKELVESIEYISTKPIDPESINDVTPKDIQLEVPEGILIKEKTISMRLENSKDITKEFIYNSSDIEVRNNVNSIENSNILIPESINVSIQYKSSIGDISKSNIVLYIDLAENMGNKIYKIKYETEYDVEKVSISPDTVEVK